MQKLKLISSIASAVLFLLTTAASSAQNNQFGVVGLFKVKNPQTVIIDNSKAKDLGCEIRRSGVIAASQGEIGLSQPNQFVFLACKTALLNNSKNRISLSSIVKGGESLAMLEGNLTNFPNANRTSTVSDRQYILKVSHYNNKDVDKRYSELNALTQESAQLPDTYVTESFIAVNQAIGLPTPDEVVILFYDDPKTGERFRNNNGAFLKKIGKFNNTHLVDTVYYVGNAIQ